jgi:hypothetical protein
MALLFLAGLFVGNLPELVSAFLFANARFTPKIFRGTPVFH